MVSDGRGSLVPGGAGDEEADGEDDLLPAMADDDYSAQLSFQTQSKDNLKFVFKSFSILHFRPSFTGYSWTISLPSNTIVMKHIAETPYQSRPFDVYEFLINLF